MGIVREPTAWGFITSPHLCTSCMTLAGLRQVALGLSAGRAHVQSWQCNAYDQALMTSVLCAACVATAPHALCAPTGSPTASPTARTLSHLAFATARAKRASLPCRHGPAEVTRPTRMGRLAFLQSRMYTPRALTEHSDQAFAHSRVGSHVCP